MDHAASLFPDASWTETEHVTSTKGARLQRWGDVQEAVIILGERRWTRKDVYELIEAGFIHGRKKKPWKVNSKYEVDLMTAWQFKHSRQREYQE